MVEELTAGERSGEAVPGIAGVASVTVDCADPSRVASWWHRLLGGRCLIDEDGNVRLDTEGATIYFERVPEPKVVKNRVHLDLRSTDLELAAAQAVALGATPALDIYDGDAWQVMRDPEGNEFCILRPGA
jgi:hypothetical protein